jgi:hypothetical protein
MGTRGTIRIRKNGKQVVMYNHWDSYPSGLGVSFLTSIQTLIDKYGLEEFIRIIDNVRVININTEHPTEEDIVKLAPYTDLSVENRSTSSWYCLMRKLQGNLLGMIEAGYMLDFGDYDMWEEYNYILDLDNKCVYMHEYDMSPSSVPDLTTPLSNIPELIKEWNSNY